MTQPPFRYSFEKNESPNKTEITSPIRYISSLCSCFLGCITTFAVISTRHMNRRAETVLNRPNSATCAGRTWTGHLTFVSLYVVWMGEQNSENDCHSYTGHSIPDCSFPYSLSPYLFLISIFKFALSSQFSMISIK